jgi:uroporphyrinogen-III synthase
VISIGPQTSRSCLQCFGRMDAEANPHDLEGLAAACAQAMQKGS